MKNSLYYYYNIYPKKIIKKDNKTYFFSDRDKIYIEEVQDGIDINELAGISNEYYFNNILVNTIIINKNKEYITKINDKNIVLIKVNSSENSELTLYDIERFQKFKVNNNLLAVNIIDKWEKEVDTLELEMMEYNKEYLIIQKSFNYFVGLAENAIQLYRELSEKLHFNSDSIAHSKLTNYKDLNNPLYFIKTDNMYDISKYFKNSFYEDRLNYNELDKYLNSDSNYLLFIHLLYPDYYFELVRMILLSNEKEEKLNFIIEKIDKYEKMLKYCKSFVNKNNKMNILKWLDE